MNLPDLLDHLRAVGTEQNRKLYARHGVRSPAFGVSYAELEKLRKRLRFNHSLALDLWTSGNHDARVLATKIADPSRMLASHVSNWVAEIDNHVLAEAVAHLIAQTPAAEAFVATWTAMEDEWASAVGWNTLAALALLPIPRPIPFFLPYIDAIEKRIHLAPNRTRHAMNAALIAIGVRHPDLTHRALEVAAHIGPVSVDHGDTQCETPDATAYIRRTLDRRRASPQPAPRVAVK